MEQQEHCERMKPIDRLKAGMVYIQTTTETSEKAGETLPAVVDLKNDLNEANEEKQFTNESWKWTISCGRPVCSRCNGRLVVEYATQFGMSWSCYTCRAAMQPEAMLEALYGFTPIGG